MLIACLWLEIVLGFGHEFLHDFTLIKVSVYVTDKRLYRVLPHTVDSSYLKDHFDLLLAEALNVIAFGSMQNFKFSIQSHFHTFQLLPNDLLDGAVSFLKFFLFMFSLYRNLGGQYWSEYSTMKLFETVWYACLVVVNCEWGLNLLVCFRVENWLKNFTWRYMLAVSRTLVKLEVTKNEPPKQFWIYSNCGPPYLQLQFE